VARAPVSSVPGLSRAQFATEARSACPLVACRATCLVEVAGSADYRRRRAVCAGSGVGAGDVRVLVVQARASWRNLIPFVHAVVLAKAVASGDPSPGEAVWRSHRMEYFFCDVRIFFYDVRLFFL